MPCCTNGFCFFHFFLNEIGFSSAQGALLIYLYLGLSHFSIYSQGSPIYRELCGLAQQIGRPDLALSLIVLAIALPPNARLSNSSSGQHASSNVACNLAASVTYAGLVRRLGRALAPALPRLVPRIFIRRFDYARPRLRQAMENVWLGLVSYASNSATPSLACVTSCSTLNLSTSAGHSGQSTASQPGLQQPQQQATQSSPNHVPSNSVHALASEMVSPISIWLDNLGLFCFSTYHS